MIAIASLDWDRSTSTIPGSRTFIGLPPLLRLNFLKQFFHFTSISKPSLLFLPSPPSVGKKSKVAFKMYRDPFSATDDSMMDLFQLLSLLLSSLSLRCSKKNAEDTISNSISSDSSTSGSNLFPSESPQLQLPQLQSPQDLQLPVPLPLAPSFPPSAPFRRRCAKQPWKFRQLVGNVGKGRILGYREGDQAYVPMFLCSLLSNLLNTVNGLNDLIDDSIWVERKIFTSIRLDRFTETVSKDASIHGCVARTALGRSLSSLLSLTCSSTVEDDPGLQSFQWFPLVRTAVSSKFLISSSSHHLHVVSYQQETSDGQKWW